jgi:hypothetical protein
MVHLHFRKILTSRGILNFVFVAEEAFALRETILNPFRRKDLTHEKQIFNYRSPRA